MEKKKKQANKNHTEDTSDGQHTYLNKAAHFNLSEIRLFLADGKVHRKGLDVPLMRNDTYRCGRILTETPPKSQSECPSEVY